jgi:hypothetical protein
VFANFGEDDPRGMPPHFFFWSWSLDYTSAVRADVSKQNFSVAPRHWYVDATMPCKRCGRSFCSTADEQKTWYEDFGFYVDSIAKHCPACRKKRRELKSLRQEYDRDIAKILAGDDLDAKVRLASVIDELCESGESLPAKVYQNRKVLAVHIARRREPGAA